MRDILERVEELLSLQEKLVNLLLLSGSHRAKLSANTALDVLYYNVELLDLIGEILSSPEEPEEDYAINLILEALSWMGFILPAVEESCPIFFQGVRGRDPFQKIRHILGVVEEAYRRSDHYMLMNIAKEVQSLSVYLRYQMMLAHRAYVNLT